MKHWKKHWKKLIAVALLAALLLTGLFYGTPAAVQPVAQEESAAQELRAAPAQEPVRAQALSALLSSPLEPRHKSAAPLFSAKFEGDRVAGTAGIVDGVYRIAATQTDGESWHIKLECNYPTLTGHEYYVAYRFHSDVAGRVKFGDFQEFGIVQGDNEVIGLVIAKGSTTYLDLQLGMLSPFTVDFSEIEILELQDDVRYENALPAPVEFDGDDVLLERHDSDYSPMFMRDTDYVTVNYDPVSRNPAVWKARLYVNTGMVPQPGVRYRVSADLFCAEDMDYELLLNRGEQEKGYGALYGRHLTGGELQTVEHILTMPENGFADGELVLQFSLGCAPEDENITVSNIHVDRVSDSYRNVLPAAFKLNTQLFNGKTTTTVTPTDFSDEPLTRFSYSGTDAVRERHDDGYVVSLEEAADSATLRITQVPAEGRGVWKVQLFAETGLTLEGGQTYRIRYALASNGDQANYEACFDGDYENAYGALYGRSLTAGGTDLVEHIVTPDVSHGPLTLRLQLGETDSTAGNTVTLSGLSVERLQPDYNRIADASLTLDGEGNVWEEHGDGVAQTVSASGTAATLNVSAARSGGGVWSSRLFVKTGVTPEPGARYRVSLTMNAAQPIDGFELVCDNDGTENGYPEGKATGLSLPAGADTVFTTDFTAPASGCGELALRLQLGNTPAENTVTVSGIQVCKLSGDAAQTELALTGFAYPTGSAASSLKNSFDLEANNGAAATLTGDGSSATATVTTPGDDWHIKLYAKPGLTLEAGESYTVSFDVANASGAQVCYKRLGGEETDFGTETVSGDGTVTHTVTPGTGGELEILLKLGALPANTAVTLRNIQITQAGTGYVPLSLTGFAYPVTTGAGSVHVDEGYVAQTVNASATAVAWDGSAAEPSASGNSATLNVTNRRSDEAGGMWSTRLEIDTGVTLEQGAQYRVSGTLSSAQPFEGFEVLYSNGSGLDEGEGYNPGGQGYAEGSWGLNVAEANGSVNFEKVFTVPARSEYRPLTLRVQAGNAPAPNTITVSNIRVEKFVPAHDETSEGTTENNSFDLEANSGAAATLTGDSTSATATVTTHGDDWHIKLYAKPGVELLSGHSYQISLNAANADGAQVCYKRLGGEETDFGTETVSGGTAVHTVTPAMDGTLEILLKLGALPDGTAVTVSGITISEYTAGDFSVLPESFAYPVIQPDSLVKNSFDLEENGTATALLSGDGNSATATVTASGDDWHLKLYAKPGVSLEAGQSYRISMNVTGAAGCTACYKRVGGEETDFGTETLSGDGVVTHTVTPTTGGELEILLKLGTLPSGRSVTVSDVSIQQVGTETPGENLMTAPLATVARGSVNFWAHGDYEAALSGDGSSATLSVANAPADGKEPWKVKLFVETGLTLSAGKHYRVCARVDADTETDYEICYNNGAEEKGVGALYGLQVSTAGAVSLFDASPERDAELILQFNLGLAAAPTAFHVREVFLEEMTVAGAEDILPSFRYDSVGSFGYNKDDGYVVSLAKAEDSATFTIHQAPDARDPWRVKLNVNTGFTPAPGQAYVVSYDVEAASDQGSFEVFLDGAKEAAYGEVFGLGLHSGKNSFSHIVYPDRGSGVLTLQLRVGKTNGTDGNSYTVSNVKLQRVRLIYNTYGQPEDTSSLRTELGYVGTLSRMAKQVSVRLTASPKAGREAWKTKLFIPTGVNLQAGKKYRISYEVFSNADTPYELCLNRSGVEKEFGAMYGLTASYAPQAMEYIFYAEKDGYLELQFSLGNALAPCSFNLSNLRVERAAGTSEVAHTIYSFR